MRDAIAQLACPKLCRGHLAFEDCPRVAEHYARADEVLAGLDVATLEKALEIGRTSYDGDPWFAKEAGWDYDDAEATLSAAAAIVEALGKP